MASANQFLRPAAGERFFNRLYGIALRFGLAFSHNYLLEVRGRKSGRVFTTPINLLDYKGRRYLVANRGQTQWLRNARAAGRVVLAKAGRRTEFVVRDVPDDQKPELLKEFLERFKASVQRFYTVKPGSPVEAFKPMAPECPVLELIEAGAGRSRA